MESHGNRGREGANCRIPTNSTSTCDAGRCWSPRWPQRVLSGMTRFRWVPVAALAWLSACESAATAPSDGLRIETFVSATELVAPGDSVIVRVVVTNTSRWPSATSLSNPCHILFEVRDANGSLVPAPSGSPCLTVIVPPTPLRPGERVERTEVWRGVRLSPTLVPLPPGTYQIHGRELWNGLTSTPVTVLVR
jgi:hypothetical protein